MEAAAASEADDAWAGGPPKRAAGPGAEASSAGEAHAADEAAGESSSPEVTGSGAPAEEGRHGKQTYQLPFCRFRWLREGGDPHQQLELDERIKMVVLTPRLALCGPSYGPETNSTK